MQPTTRPRVKICCIMSETEAEIAVAQGASALGLVAEMPSGPGVIPDAEIARISRCVPPGVTTVLLTSRRDPASIVAHQRATGTNAVQIVDTLRAGGHEDLRAALPGIGLMQVIHVSGEDAIQRGFARGAVRGCAASGFGAPGSCRQGVGRDGPPPRLDAEPAHPRALADSGLPGRRPVCGQRGARYR